jgi:hypothetical protein
MRTRLSKKLAVTITAGLCACALAAPGSASAATPTCAKSYSLVPALEWYMQLLDYNNDGFMCLKRDKWGTPVALTDDTLR